MLPEHAFWSEKVCGAGDSGQGSCVCKSCWLFVWNANISVAVEALLEQSRT
jgi:hypothetical protein